MEKVWFTLTYFSKKQIIFRLRRPGNGRKVFFGLKSTSVIWSLHLSKTAYCMRLALFDTLARMFSFVYFIFQVRHKGVP